jgi:hypothetical protein
MCRIEENFNSTVGKQMEQFKQKLRCEILALDLQIPARMIQGIDITPGKVIYKLIKSLNITLNVNNIKKHLFMFSKNSMYY